MTTTSEPPEKQRSPGPSVPVRWLILFDIDAAKLLNGFGLEGKGIRHRFACCVLVG